MLHHGNIPVGRLLFNFHAPFFDFFKLNFLILLRFGVDCGASESRIERRLSKRCISVAHQLQIQLRRERHAACIDDVVTHGNVISAAL